MIRKTCIAVFVIGLLTMPAVPKAADPAKFVDGPVVVLKPKKKPLSGNPKDSETLIWTYRKSETQIEVGAGDPLKAPCWLGRGLSRNLGTMTLVDSDNNKQSVTAVTLEDDRISLRLELMEDPFGPYVLWTVKKKAETETTEVVCSNLTNMILKQKDDKTKYWYRAIPSELTEFDSTARFNDLKYVEGAGKEKTTDWVELHLDK